MKYIKLYENFEDIRQICDLYGIEGYTINQDESVDVDGDVRLENKGLRKIPLKFGKVYGNFSILNNFMITSLLGSPTEVKKNFICSSNKLTTLLNGPKIVLGDYFAKYNKLTDFNGYPENFMADSYFIGNPVHEILELVGIAQEEKFIKWLNEYDVMRDGNKIVEMRLEEAYWMATKKELPLNCRDFKNYQLI